MVDHSTLSRIRELKLSGKSLREIGREVGVSRTTVMRLTRDIPSAAPVGRRATRPDAFCIDCGRLTRRKVTIRCNACNRAHRRAVRDGAARCSRCEEWKPLDAFSPTRHSTRGVRSWCKACVAADNRKRFGDDPRKSYARLAVLRAIRAGKLVREPCEVCGTNDDVEGHHDDYSRPLHVRWLCPPHHLIEHCAA